ncbi:uncharacterized protein BO80DRAFT_408323 [Aspergillus ibericus CBS 121593]|uniref:Plant heme peroxidase family profile domain-containing protein n=1 Tax=Aspergillus ibericus CBS 121593 TaxID=1448316 RepID=A0A395GY85_9EURO|nr:hypothetical protein BO80DRAFT_408323 [Aspergillus ibericus CBS 121593]RAL00551.1 hypothetical protein BO80DRAFT_408323 [Aspergillus ibericus CBS 121593]
MQVSRSGGPGYSNGQASDSPQKSQTRGQSGRLEEHPGCAFLKRSDSRDTDFYQIFPMEVDKDISMNPPIIGSKVLKDAFSDKGTAEYHGAPGISLDMPLLKAGHESTIASCGKTNRETPSPVRPENCTFDVLNERTLYERNCPVSPEAQTTWKPPRPPKPRFLSDLDVADSRAHENASLSPTFDPKGHLHNKRMLPDSPGPYSTPQGCSRSRIRLANRSILLQGMDHEHRKQQRRPWSNPKPGPSRYVPRPPSRSPNTFLKDDTSRPFPAPLPSIDNLPLRQDLKVVRPKDVNVHFQDLGDVFSNQQPIRISTWKNISNCFQKVLGWILHWLKPEERRVVCLSLVGERSVQQPSHLGHQTYSFNVTLDCSIKSKPMVTREGQDMNLSASYSDPVRLFRVDFTVPFRFLQVLARLGIALRSLMFPQAVAIVVQLFLRFVGPPILYVLEKLSISMSIHSEKPAAAAGQTS